MSKQGDLWGMGSNKNFRMKSNMEERLDTFNRLDLEVQNFKLKAKDLLRSESRSHAYSKKQD